MVEKMNKKILAALSIAMILLFAGCAAQEKTTEKKEDVKDTKNTTVADSYKIVVDMRGKEVKVPKEISRVVTIDDGFAAGVMSSIGVEDKIVALGSGNIKSVDEYTYEGENGNYTYARGMNPVTLIHPELKELPVVAEYGREVYVEIDQVIRGSDGLAGQHAGLGFLQHASISPDESITNLELHRQMVDTDADD